MPKAKRTTKPKWKDASIVRKRRAVKYAMAATMAACVITGFQKGKGAKQLHIATGFAVVGLSFYHTSLYPKAQRS